MHAYVGTWLTYVVTSFQGGIQIEVSRHTISHTKLLILTDISSSSYVVIATSCVPRQFHLYTHLPMWTLYRFLIKQSAAKCIAS